MQRRLGYSALLIQATMLVLVAVPTIFSGWLGSLQLATLSAAWLVNAPIALVVIGLADATAIEVATQAGRGRVGRPGLSVWTSFALLGLLLVPVLAICIVFPEALARLFSGDAGLRDGLGALIPATCCVLVFDALCFIAAASLRGMRDIAWPTAIEIGTLAAMVPLAAAFAFGWGAGVLGIVIAGGLTAALRAALLIGRFVVLNRNAAIRAG